MNKRIYRRKRSKCEKELLDAGEGGEGGRQDKRQEFLDVQEKEVKQFGMETS